jgi:ribosomal protein RSM22 (predicted rRNA methylase)
VGRVEKKGLRRGERREGRVMMGVCEEDGERVKEIERRGEGGGERRGMGEGDFV